VITLVAVALATAACEPSNDDRAGRPTTAPATGRAAATTAVPPGPASSGAEPGSDPAGGADEGDLRDVWVDPVAGDDGRDGATRATAVRTIAAAWERVPRGTLEQGRRIALTAGTYAVDDMPNYWDERTGTAAAPIVIESVDGPGAAVTGNMNVFDVDHLTVRGVHLRSPNDVFHCERCDALVLRDVVLEGVGTIADGAGPQETLKVNQSTDVVVEGSDISGATDNALDFVAVQRARIVGNHIHRATDWCAYVKGGSVDVEVAGNEIDGCGTGGFTAGQGTGLQFMVEPYVDYEARDVRVVNNFVHDTEGAAFGAAGAYGVLIAYNTAYRVGSRSQLLDIVLGRRSCDGAPDDHDAVARCRELLAAGAWGTDGEEVEIIPSRSVWIFDNVFVNPAGTNAGSQVFQIHSCRTAEPTTNVASPACVDDDLRIEGNVIWAGSDPVPLGAEGELAAAIEARNTIGVDLPELVDPDHGDLRPRPGSALAGAAAVPIPAMTSAPAGSTASEHPDPTVATDRRAASAAPRPVLEPTSTFPANGEGVAIDGGYGRDWHNRLARSMKTSRTHIGSLSPSPRPVEVPADMSVINTEILPFTATAYENGEFVEVSDADLKGSWSVVFFYPADFTFVCPTELGDLADNYETFQSLGVKIFSVSTDTHFTHKAWHDTSDTIGKIQYAMIGDPTLQISKNFQILRDSGLADRGTFIVDPEGVIQAIEITAEGIGRNATELIRKVKAAQYVASHPGEVCPAKWEEGDDTLTPGLDLVGKI